MFANPDDSPQRPGRQITLNPLLVETNLLVYKLNPKQTMDAHFPLLSFPDFFQPVPVEEFSVEEVLRDMFGTWGSRQGVRVPQSVWKYKAFCVTLTLD